MTKQIWKSDNGQEMTQYHLTTAEGYWLADVFMQPNGFIFISSAFGDWSWRFTHRSPYSGLTIELYILIFDVDRLATAVYKQWKNITGETKKLERAAKCFASHVLPALQEAIRESQCNDISAL